MPAAAEAAQVAAQGDGGEAAVAASVQALNDTKVIQSFKLNNVALKLIRCSHDNPRGCPTTTIVELTDMGPIQIGVVERTGGMDYSFKVGETTPWSWKQLLAGMTADYQEIVLGSNPR